MRRKRLFAILLPAPLLALLFGLGSSTLTACGNGGTGGDCFDYAGFDGMSPKVTFKADVLPIFRLSCGLSTSCHGMPGGGALAGQLYYGPSNMDPPPTAADIMAILAGSVGKASAANPDMEVIMSAICESNSLVFARA